MDNGVLLVFSTGALYLAGECLTYASAQEANHGIPCLGLVTTIYQEGQFFSIYCSVEVYSLELVFMDLQKHIGGLIDPGQVPWLKH